MPPWVRGQPAAGARRGPAAAVRSRDTAEPSQRRAKPGGHNVSWAATEAAPLGEGEGKTTLVNETFLLFTVTFVLISQQLQYL